MKTSTVILTFVFWTWGAKNLKSPIFFVFFWSKNHWLGGAALRGTRAARARLGRGATRGAAMTWRWSRAWKNIFRCGTFGDLSFWKRLELECLLNSLLWKYVYIKKAMLSSPVCYNDTWRWAFQKESHVCLAAMQRKFQYALRLFFAPEK